MTELFGAVAGARQQQIDEDAHRLNLLSALSEQTKIMGAQMTLAQQAKMLQLMGGTDKAAPPAPDELASTMDRMSMVAVQAGRFDQAEKYADTGSQIRANQSLIQERSTKAMVANMNLMGSLLENVNDQTSWQRANAGFRMMTGKAPPWANAPYSPELVQNIRNGVQSAK